MLRKYRAAIEGAVELKKQYVEEGTHNKEAADQEVADRNEASNSILLTTFLRFEKVF